MKLVALLGALIMATPLAVVAQQAAPAAPPGFEIPKDMTTYYVALYVRGPKFMEADSPEHQALTKRHLSYIRKMIEQKTYVFAGPLLDGGDKQGLAIVAAPSIEDASASEPNVRPTRRHARTGTR